ncbi:unnamed protein product, partial [Larinioides sclopetarius]
MKFHIQFHLKHKLLRIRFWWISLNRSPDKWCCYSVFFSPNFG